MAQESKSGVLASLSKELAEIVERVGPSVVRVDDGTRLTATGVVWSSDGVVVATSHGVERDEDLAIEMADGARHTATVVGRDPDTDLAVLRVQASGMPTAPHAVEDTVRIGHLVLALGRPGNAGLQATIGIVSARLETQTLGRPGYVLHTDAVLYPGFSGGPLVGIDGQVVGINNLMFSRGRGMAVGTPVIDEVVQALLQHGQIRRGYLGVRTQSVTLPETLRKSLTLEQESGSLIVQVETGSPAEQAGLLLGDTLIRIDEKVVEDVDSLRHTLRALHAGQTVALHVVRGGALHNVTATLTAQE